MLNICSIKSFNGCGNPAVLGQNSTFKGVTEDGQSCIGPQGTPPESQAQNQESWQSKQFANLSKTVQGAPAGRKGRGRQETIGRAIYGNRQIEAQEGNQQKRGRSTKIPPHKTVECRNGWLKAGIGNSDLRILNSGATTPYTREQMRFSSIMRSSAEEDLILRSISATWM